MWYFGWLFIVCIVMGFVSATMTNRSSGWLNTFWANMTGLFLLGGLIGWTFAGLYYKMNTDVVYNLDKIQTDTVFIKSASLNSELHGQFVLGCGSVDEQDVYKFYEIIDSTSYKMKSVPTVTTRIQEMDSDASFVPHIVSYHYTEYTRNNSWLVRAMLNREEVEISTNQRILKEHILYVPKGTIVGDLSELNL